MRTIHKAESGAMIEVILACGGWAWDYSETYYNNAAGLNWEGLGDDWDAVVYPTEAEALSAAIKLA